MPIANFLFSCITLLFFGIEGYGQSVQQADVDIRSNIEAINRAQGRALELNDLNAVVKNYDPDALVLPEFFPQITGVTKIREYFKNWLKVAGFTRFKKETTEVLVIREFLIESGTFSHQLTVSGKPGFNYTGKYIAVWKQAKPGELSKVSEIWGTDKNLSSEDIYGTGFSYALPYGVSEVHSALAVQINRRNAMIEAAIKKRDGLQIASAYLPDAIYMPYYDGMIKGIDSIRAYYARHENPAVAIDSVSIRPSRIIDLGNFALINGFYGVKWRAGNNSGTVNGKSINLWKRADNGEWMLFRQMTNHDR
jgi:ketosteroid isomerase-like protein